MRPPLIINEPTVKALADLGMMAGWVLGRDYVVSERVPFIAGHEAPRAVADGVAERAARVEHDARYLLT
jgi:hypothetical protein